MSGVHEGKERAIGPFFPLVIVLPSSFFDLRPSAGILDFVAIIFTSIY
jgi:hypothetical protein